MSFFLVAFKVLILISVMFDMWLPYLLSAWNLFALFSLTIIVCFLLDTDSIKLPFLFPFLFTFIYLFLDSWEKMAMAQRLPIHPSFMEGQYYHFLRSGWCFIIYFGFITINWRLLSYTMLPCRLAPSSSLEMLIPANAVGKVMGKGGANLANIRKVCPSFNVILYYFSLCLWVLCFISGLKSCFELYWTHSRRARNLF